MNWKSVRHFLETVSEPRSTASLAVEADETGWQPVLRHVLKPLLITASLLAVFTPLGSDLAVANDWPMWRGDAARSAQSNDQLPDKLHRRWTIELPKLKPAYREKRLQFDAGYEPIVVGKRMFVASSWDDSVTAFDTETGRRLWQFFAEGPIRFAPVAWQDRVAFGSDDGCLYCLNATSGKVEWKLRAVPSQRKVLSNGRMISLWPVRGGPVLHENRIYFAAGVWPFEGVFIYCVDAKTGDVVWRNDEASFVYGQHPHNTNAMGGVTPQGYLVVSGDNLVVPCGQAMPATFDLATGKLKSFELPAPGRQPGGWFASAAVRRGEVTLDKETNQDLHEDKIYQGPGSSGVRTKIKVGEKTFLFANGIPDVDGVIHTMLAADGKLFVVTLAGQLYCFGSESTDEPLRHKKLRHINIVGNAKVDLTPILKFTKARHGYALVQYQATSNLLSKLKLTATIDALLKDTNFHVVVLDDDERRIQQMCESFCHDRDRVSLLANLPGQVKLPRYFASLLVTEQRSKLKRGDLEVLRPNGGVACVATNAAEHKRLLGLLLFSDPHRKEFSIKRSGNLTIIRRDKLQGAANYTGDWSSSDELVRAPLGVLWFDDTLGHFKRSPQPWFVDGAMISYPKDWMAIHRDKRRPPYDLLPPVYSDVYTGRIISPDEAIVAGLKIPKRDLKEAQPTQYRPPKQKDDWKPEQPVAGKRINPLTGEKEPRSIPKSYGCDGGVDYGHIYTMRSGTPAFYDKRIESGVCSISGPRSGCTNSIIPAGGVLNVPFFYEGCTCSYPLPVGLSLVSMPQTHEQWSSWGPGKTENIQRVGINFGAPGDRMTKGGTLWLDYPSRGGPSPEVSVNVEPKSATYFYQHSLFVKGGSAWPWVAASGVEGAETITVAGLQPAIYNVRLYFIDKPEYSESGERVFDIEINNALVTKDLAVAKVSGGRLYAFARQYKDVESTGELKIRLTAKTGRTILSGLEIIKKGLPLD